MNVVATRIRNVCAGPMRSLDTHFYLGLLMGVAELSTAAERATQIVGMIVGMIEVWERS